MFLKENCGDGYMLTVVRGNREVLNDDNEKKWAAAVADFVKRQISSAAVIDAVNGETHLRLGYDTVGAFPQCLAAIEKSQKELDISEFGITDSSMEEVFIKMADMADEQDGTKEKEDAVIEVAPTSMPQYQPKTGISLTSGQFWGLLVKRFHRMRRNWRGFVSELILPIVFVLLGVLIIKAGEYEPGNAKTIELHPWGLTPSSQSTMDQKLYMFASSRNMRFSNISTLETNVDRAMANSKYAGTRCVDPNIYKIEDYPCTSSADSEWKQATDRYQQKVCQCTSEGVQKCEDDPSNSNMFLYRSLQTGDDLFNLTGLNVPDYIINQYKAIKSNFYGGYSYLEHPGRGLTEGNTEPSSILYSMRLIAPSTVTVWFNNKGFVSSAGYNNYVNNLLYRLAVSQSVSSPSVEHGLVGFNKPLNYTKEQFVEQLTRNVLIDVILAIMLILALSFIPASFVMFLIEDRVSDSKHVQIVSGLRPSIYWLGNYTWDCVNFVIPAFICIIIFLIFDLQAYVNEKSIGALILLFILYGIAIAPMLYITSFIFDTPSTAFVMLASANLLIGAGTTVATWFLDFLAMDDPDIADVNDILKLVFFIFPQYCLGRGLVDMATSYRQAQGSAYFLGKDNFLDNHNPFDWDICGQFFFALAIHLVGWFIVVMLIEYRMAIFKCCYVNRCGSSCVVPHSPEPTTDDPDVAAEKEAVLADYGGSQSNRTMLVKNLKKVFRTSRGKLTAVNKLTFGVNNGECFGLLGVNGAGKSTTFNMLTGRLLPTSGSASIRGFDILGARNDANKMIGYCPQYDCITPLLTGRENLEFFARLRGVPENLVKQVAECNITRMDLTRHSEKQAGTYSGGNKRKLSAAIALTGEPPLVFLDEPTAGMDPRARRFLWKCITKLLVNGQSVVLTTHSMDECEALCTRLAIMVNGEFRCLGSPQHLKAKYGEGYLVNLRFKNETDSRSVSDMAKEFGDAEKALKDRFGDVIIKEAHDNVATYAIGSEGKEPVKLSDLFSFVTNQSNLSSLKITEYSVMQCSLDAVFVTFAKMQVTDMSDAERNATMNNNNNQQT